MNKPLEVDYVIVGAGSAGCVLANRLSVDPGIRVAVLEAGGPDSDPFIRIPFAWVKMATERRNDWGYSTEPEPGLDGRIMECVRGKVLGGCWSINAMAYVRGNPGDYERWSDKGLTDWGYDSVLPYFKRAENWEDGGDAWRGTGGPIRTIKARSDDPLHEAYRTSALEIGIPWTDDYNGRQNEGIGYAHQTIRNGFRESGVTAYLKPALGRPNLQVVTGAHAHEILFEGSRAVGIAYEKDGDRREVRVGREVILSGGVINSPQLLMLSGVGPAVALATHGIKARVDAKGVGENLQDHISAGVSYKRKARGPVHASMRADRAAVNFLRAYWFGTGPMSTFPNRYAAFIKTRTEEPIPDVQLLFGGASMGAYAWFPGYRKPYEDLFSCRVAVLHPKSRGRLELSSSDPKAPIRIRQNFFTDPADMATIKRGIAIVRDMVGRKAFAEFTDGEAAPGAADLDAHITNTCSTVHHPLGTCRMGADQDSVVDPELRVRGLDGLRVVDASVMPDLTGGNINATVIMIAEKASDLILGNQRPI